ncbi:MAG: TIGR02221 family CRISPR-associated protein [Helicobacteraceae bacterium]|jgi:CRISPR-associated Csx2 family protein|nr:TIGR02221 family CRISPR-associated protein [Helicobacteraceae bacterium]
MAKILITSVGTGEIKKDSDGEYKKTVYRIDGEEHEGTYIADILIKLKQIDNVIFIGTNKSAWDNLYLIFAEDDVEDEIYDKTHMQKLSTAGVEIDMLQHYLRNVISKNRNADSHYFILDYENKDTHNETWNNLQKLFEIRNLIKDGDEVYLDITHGFRYMPILNIFLLQFLSIYNNYNFLIKGVYYGMLSDEISEVIDFKIFFDLLKWANAINIFKRHLNADSLIGIMSENGVDSEIVKVFTQINNNLHIANLASLWQFFKNAKSKIEKIKAADNRLLSLLSDDVIGLVGRLNKTELSSFQYEISKWFCENNQYALSYLALHEAIVTKACELKYPDESSEDEELRRKVKMENIDYPYDKLFLEKRLSKRPNLDSITSIRNSIAHQLNDRKDKVNQDIERLKHFIREFQPYFEVAL